MYCWIGRTSSREGKSQRSHLFRISLALWSLQFWQHGVRRNQFVVSMVERKEAHIRTSCFALKKRKGILGGVASLPGWRSLLIHLSQSVGYDYPGAKGDFWHSQAWRQRAAHSTWQTCVHSYWLLGRSVSSSCNNLLVRITTDYLWSWKCT